MITDVCIIGGGPAGLSAAIAAGYAGARVIVIEQNTTLGRKLLKTGRGRCNITHVGGIDDFIKAFGSCGRFLKPALYEFSPQAVVRYFEEHGVPTKIEKDGCYFPVSDKATDVLHTVIESAKEAGVQFLYGKTVQDIEQRDDGFVVMTNKETVEASAVILATGGVSWPNLGSTGEGFKLAEKLGHTITPLRASVCPVCTVEDWPSQMQGVAIETVVVRCHDKGVKAVCKGALIFTDKGFGGPAAFDLSMAVTDYLDAADEPIEITIDFLPKLDSHELDVWLVDQCGKNAKREIANILGEFFVRRFCDMLVAGVGLRPDVPAGQLKKAQRKQLINVIKLARLRINAVDDLKKATVTRGGVSRKEIDSKTMQSRIVPGLYFAGEAIDADGPCGGYNLQIAWSTGSLAGRAAAKSVV